MKTRNDKILNTKRQYEDEWLTFEDIHAVSVGYKEVNGVKSDDLAIVVHTANKKPICEIPHGQVIPPRVNGILTDVKEMPPFDYIPTEFDDADIPNTMIDGKKYRPVPGGVEIYMPRTPTNGGICTLGMYAQSIKEGDSSSDLYLLTNAHCLRQINQVVSQPISDLESDIIADSTRVIDNERIDGGIAKMTSYQEAEPFEIVDIGTIRGVYDVSIDNLGDRVIKRGRTSGVTTGIIDYVYVKIIEKMDQIVIKGEVPFALPGDSGSVVLMDDVIHQNNVMGLLWGGVLNYAILSPIRAVSEELEIELITDQIPIFVSNQ